MQFPAGLNAWLNYPCSLTDKLRGMTSSVHLELMGQQFDIVRPHDVERFGVNEKLVFRREIRIRDASGPCWYAMTVIPQPVHAAHASMFSHLETGSLGELVFHHPRIRRESLSSTLIPVDADAFARLSGESLHVEARLPSRLSVFRISPTHGAFYLVEMFLPGICRYCP